MVVCENYLGHKCGFRFWLPFSIRISLMNGKIIPIPLFLCLQNRPTVTWIINVSSSLMYLKTWPPPHPTPPPGQRRRAWSKDQLLPRPWQANWLLPPPASHSQAPQITNTLKQGPWRQVSLFCHLGRAERILLKRERNNCKSQRVQGYHEKNYRIN